MEHPLYLDTWTRVQAAVAVGMFDPGAVAAGSPSTKSTCVLVLLVLGDVGWAASGLPAPQRVERFERAMLLEYGLPTPLANTYTHTYMDRGMDLITTCPAHTT